MGRLSLVKTNVDAARVRFQNFRGSSLQRGATAFDHAKLTLFNLRRGLLEVALRIFLLAVPIGSAISIPLIGEFGEVNEPAWVRPTGHLQYGSTANWLWLALAVVPILLSFLFIDSIFQASFLAERFCVEKDAAAHRPGDVEQATESHGGSEGAGGDGKCAETPDAEGMAPPDFDAFVNMHGPRLTWSEICHRVVLSLYVLSILLVGFLSNEPLLPSAFLSMNLVPCLVFLAVSTVIGTLFSVRLRLAVLRRYRRRTSHYVAKMSVRLVAVLFAQVFLVIHMAMDGLSAPPLVEPFAFLAGPRGAAALKTCISVVNSTWLHTHCQQIADVGHAWFDVHGAEPIRGIDSPAIGPNGISCHDNGEYSPIYQSLFAACESGRVAGITHASSFMCVLLSLNGFLVILFGELCVAYGFARYQIDEWVRWRVPFPFYRIVGAISVACSICPAFLAIFLDAEPYAGLEGNGVRTFRFGTLVMVLAWINVAAWLYAGMSLLLLQRGSSLLGVLGGGDGSRDSAISQTYDAFISYRVAADSMIANMIFDKLSLMGFRPFLDRTCLVGGCCWETQFVDALSRSGVFVPILSHDALRSIKQSGVDNLILEQRLARELEERKEVHAMHPILVGNLYAQAQVAILSSEQSSAGVASGSAAFAASASTSSSSARSSSMDSTSSAEKTPPRVGLGDVYVDFFQGLDLPSWCPEGPLPEVEAAVATHLTRLGKGPPRVAVAERGVRATIDHVMCYQGSVVRGPQMEAIDRAVDQIATSIVLNRPERRTSLSRRRLRRAETVGLSVRDTLHSFANFANNVFASTRLASVRHRMTTVAVARHSVAGQHNEGGNVRLNRG